MEKITANNKIMKLISAFLIVSIIAPAVLFSSPKKATAGIPVSVLDSVSDVWGWLTEGYALLTKASTLINTASTLVNTAFSAHQWLLEVGKKLLRVAAKRLLAKMTQATINWINQDFHGAPLFLENPQSFFKDIAKSEVRNMVDMIGYDTLRYPFGKQIAHNVIDSYKRQLATNAQYTLSKVINDPDLLRRYQNDFDFGGWNGFLINTQYPQNNYLGFKMMVEDNLASKVEGTMVPPAQKIKETLSQGMGFLSPQTCPSNDKYNNGFNEFSRPSFQYPPFDDTKVDVTACTTESCQLDKENEAFKQYNIERDAKRAKWAEANTCPSGLVNTTPGSVAANQIFTALDTPILSTMLDGALGNSVAAIFDALLNHFFEKGLNMLADTVSGRNSGGNDNWSFDGQTLDGNIRSGETLGVGAGQMDDTGNVLICPEETTNANNISADTNKATSVTVSVGVGKTISVPIFGGDGEYIINNPGDTTETTETANDSTLATAKINVSSSSGKNNKLKITGLKSGTTTLTIEDFSSPIQNAFVTINVGNVGNDASNDNIEGLLVCPGNISIDAGANNTIIATILGGDGNYSIQKSPNETIATADVVDTNLLVTGNQNGVTSLDIKDHSSPAKRAHVNITIGVSDLVVAPQNIPVAVGKTASAVISGGNGNYSVENQTDDSKAVATVDVSGNKLNIVGFAPGEIKVIVQDSSNSAEAIEVTVTVRNPGDLIVSPSNISVDAGQEKTATIFGGQKPYSKKNGPNKKIANVKISGNELTVRGLINGTTSLNVKDHSGKTTHVNITVGPQDSLVVVPSDFSVNAGEVKSFPISISNGAGTYGVAYQEDTQVANAELDVSNPSSPKLKVTAGSKLGATTVTIQDNSTIAKTADITIETLAP